jgi:hypothetical protein
MRDGIEHQDSWVEWKWSRAGREGGIMGVWEYDYVGIDMDMDVDIEVDIEARCGERMNEWVFTLESNTDEGTNG